MSNLRQLGVACLAYAQDDDGNVIGWQIDSPGPAGDGVVLLPQFYGAEWLDTAYALLGKNVDALLCPAQETRLPTWLSISSPLRKRGFYPGYSMSMWTVHYCGPYDNYKWGPVLNLSQVRNAGSTVWFADGSYRSPVPYQHESYGQLIAKSEAYIGSATNGTFPISKRHRGGSNILFIDGHVEWFHYDAIMPKGDILPWGDPVANALYKKYWDPDHDGNTCTP